MKIESGALGMVTGACVLNTHTVPMATIKAFPRRWTQCTRVARFLDSGVQTSVDTLETCSRFNFGEEQD
jgi:hypothetical protein